MNEQELCRKRLLDLSRQADRKGIVLFSDFLNLNEQNIFHSLQKELYTTAELSGGYEQAERQMVAFIPDALCYEWSYPFVCIHAVPQYPKYAEKLTHRDVLGALMHLGLDRSKIGDIVLLENDIYIFLFRDHLRFYYGSVYADPPYNDPKFDYRRCQYS